MLIIFSSSKDFLNFIFETIKTASNVKLDKRGG